MKYECYDSDESDLEFGRDCFHELTPKENVVSTIIPNKLYQSDLHVANNLKTLEIFNIKGIISLGDLYEQAQYKVHKNIDYLHIYIDDNPGEPIIDYFEEATAFINEIDGAVLIHCYAGISRSTTITAAYLMKFMNIGYQDALEIIQKARPFINPNSGFLKQLENYSNKLK
jgi:protein-tyrosine phosphatase